MLDEIMHIRKENLYPEVIAGQISGPFGIEGVQFSKLTTKMAMVRGVNEWSIIISSFFLILT